MASNIMKIKTPIGNLMVELGDTEQDYYAAVALERNDGEIVDLTEGRIMKEDNSAEISVWSDPRTDMSSDVYRISKEALMIGAV